MKKLLPSLLVAALAVSMALAAVIAVNAATVRIIEIGNPIERWAATLAEIACGTSWLLATVFVATRLAVLIFREPGDKAGA